MGEIDTKPLEPVQVALSLFGEKGDPRKQKFTNTSSDDPEYEKENDVECLLKDLANSRLQLEAKDFAYKQALLKLEYYQKVSDELSTLLKQSEADREKYIEEYMEARTRIDELESKIKEMANQLLETAKLREQLLHVLSELKAAQEELLSMETELAATREAQLKAMTQAQLMESASSIEREKAERLLTTVSELKEALLVSKLAAEAEKEKCKILSEKDAEIDLAAATAAQAQEQLEDVKSQMELMQEMDMQLLEKSILSDLLMVELKQTNQLLRSSNKATVNPVNELNQQKRETFDRAFQIEALEMELSILKSELQNANEEKGSLISNIAMLADELQKTKTEMEAIREIETEAQVEIELLKSELHKGTSEIAVADIVEEPEPVLINAEVEKSLQNLEVPQADESKTKEEENVAGMIIAVDDNLLIKKTDKAYQNPLLPVEDPNQSENKFELEILKKELEITTVKIGELRNRLEQAVTRAEAAEKAKAALEDQLRRWREQQKQKRKTALAAAAALKEVPEHRPQIFPTYEKIPATYQPLGKVLNMKF